jgi:3'-5' exoribonuclease
MAKTFISELSKGQSVETTFLVKDKVLTKTKAGSPYLSVKLIDRTGELEGRIWDNALDFLPLFEKDDFIRVRGEVDEFQGTLQLRIGRLKKCPEEEILLEDFLPSTSRDAAQMLAELKEIAFRVRQPFLRRLLESFFDDPGILKGLQSAPAAKAVHHVFLGGLLEHTLAVAQLALLVGPRYQGVDLDLLLAGAVLHDMGKTAELSYRRTFDYTDPGRLLGHITLTVEMIDERIRALPGFPENLAMLLKHLILSHHGEYEFGSPKRPKTLEALLLHQLDDLDAKMNGFLALIEKEKDTPGRWTSYHKLFERFLYKPEEER